MVGGAELGEDIGDVVGGGLGRDEQPPGAPARAVFLGAFSILENVHCCQPRLWSARHQHKQMRDDHHQEFKYRVSEARINLLGR
jgi:hypothetical protein